MKLDKIEAGSFLADGGAMFGVVPKRVWQKRYPCNDDNFCTLMMRCLVIKTDEKLIVIDTGTGVKQLEYLKYYHFKDIADFDAQRKKNEEAITKEFEKRAKLSDLKIKSSEATVGGKTHQGTKY